MKLAKLKFDLAKLISEVDKKSKDEIERSLLDILNEINENGVDTKRLKQNRQITAKSQKGVLLEFWQNNPDLQIMDVDFQNEDLGLPFIGAKPGSRLSELKSRGLVSIVGMTKASMSFEKKCRDSCIYALTEEGRNYPLKYEDE